MIHGLLHIPNEENKKAKDIKEVCWIKEPVFQSFRVGISRATDQLWPEYFDLDSSRSIHARALRRLVNCRRGCDSVLLGINRQNVHN